MVNIQTVVVSLSVLITHTIAYTPPKLNVNLCQSYDPTTQTYVMCENYKKRVNRCQDIHLIQNKEPLAAWWEETKDIDEGRVCLKFYKGKDCHQEEVQVSSRVLFVQNLEGYSKSFKVIYPCHPQK